MAILSLANDVLPYLKLAADDSFGNVNRTMNAVEAFVKTYCNRNFESATYAEVIHDFRGGEVALKNYPVTIVRKVALGLTDVLEIKNSNDYTIANVEVTSTAINFLYNTTSQSVAFATYTTINAVNTAINALGNGWSSTLINTDYAAILSTELARNYGQSALNPYVAYASITVNNLPYKLVNTPGGLILETAMTGRNDIFHAITNYPTLYVTYIAGYSSGDLPLDLKQGMLSLIGYWYNLLSNSSTGVKSFSISDYSVTYDGHSTVSSATNLPNDVKIVLDLYRTIGI